MDRDVYKANMQKALLDDEELGKTLTLVEGSVHDLIVEDGKCAGISLQDGTQLRSSSVVITTGTFLGGQCYIGANNVYEAGRFMRNEEPEAS